MQACSLIRQDEKQRHGAIPNPINPNNGTALMAFGKRIKPISGSISERQHPFVPSSSDASYAYASNSYAPRYGYVPKGDISCTCCHTECHIREECYKLNGFPPGHPEQRKRANFTSVSYHL